MARIVPTFTYDDLRQMPEDANRYELIEGVIVAGPAPTTRRQRIVMNLTEVLVDARRAGHGRAFSAPTDVVLDPDVAAVEPDLLFIARDRLGIVGEDCVQGAPDLIVEVLAPGTAHRDLGSKLRSYARYGVRFYWVADPDDETIRVYELRGGGYDEQPPLRGDDRLSCSLFPDVTVRVGDLFAE